MNAPDRLDPVFDGLSPAPVWAHFAAFCRIPRPSRGEAAIRDHLLAWATAHDIAAQVDAAGNLILRKPASPGRENAPGVILQAHLDMVCQANAGTPHDFSRDPIRPVRRDGWLVAEDTTLGADNGIGAALILAAMEDDGLVHGPLEALLTVDEEAGMGGAHGLEPGLLDGRLMLNLDTEDWGEFYLGCAGGLDVDARAEGQPEPLPAGWRVLRLSLAGLRGGHSGVNIHEERGNAIKLLVRVLCDLAADAPLRVAQLLGGTARNALPREAEALIAVSPEQAEALPTRVAAWQALLQDELRGVESGLSLHLADADADQVLAPADQTRWLHALHAAPHGVRRWSLDVPGVVETSNNLGIVELSPTGGHANFMVRSLRDSGSAALAAELLSLLALAGLPAAASGHYPGWTPNPDSPLLALCQRVYAHRFGGASTVKVVHAGLECGLIGAKYPGLDTVSFGPTIRGAHAPGERVDIASVERAWQLLGELLAAIARGALTAPA